MKRYMNYLYVICIVIGGLLTFSSFVLQPNISFIYRFAMFAGGGIVVLLAYTGMLRKSGVSLFRASNSK